jgi:glycosyltransferase involved in cell wall biosynthesis
LEPTATIVIPLLRQVDDWLAQSIRSAVSQTVPCEVIVVTSARTPGSNLALVHDFAERSCGRLRVAREEGRGFPGAVNTGFRLASAPRVGLLLSDDWLETAAVEESLRVPADIVSTGLRHFRADGETCLYHFDRTLSREAYAARPTLEARARYLTHLFVLDRSRVLAVGGLDESLGDAPGIDDYDLIWTLLETGCTVGFVERPLYNYRVHDGERLTLRDPAALVAVLRRILAKHGVTGLEQDRLLGQQSRWLGRSEEAVYAEMGWPPLVKGPATTRAEGGGQ